ncbi:AraC family transcriptional regulator [Ensifer sp. SSB1]|uniref:AraC family transcriptional regulator n=1 Tax=Ensifer sp. SSB1 TaxID=2795385 RepID=UPI001A388C50|nr:AraC family transcriptional regulator [Ensifer sp. SSB1]MBK5571724.1 AraC family transcriptional regulator [Ensifer sp. SSB1]
MTQPVNQGVASIRRFSLVTSETDIELAKAPALCIMRNEISAERKMIFNKSDLPLQVTILVLPEASLMTFAATIDPMRAANRLGGTKHYVWRVISVDGEPIVTTSETAINANGSIKDRTSQDVTFVVGSFNVEKHCTSAVRSYIRVAARSSKLICGFDTGAEALALANLLDGKQATTHWEDLEKFAVRFPGVDVQPDRFVRERNEWPTAFVID